jgi:hypothetical protein
VRADAPTFQISQIYSNLDGSVQFIELTEAAGLNDQNHFKDLTLTSTHNGVVKTFTFTNDLPTAQTAHAIVVIASAPIIRGAPVITPTMGRCCNNLPADFVVPPRFLATDGGTIDFAGRDRVSYSRLPTDGTMGLYPDDSVAPAILPGSTRMGPTLVAAVEYYDAPRNHYFISASAPDIEALDSGTIPGWQRTGATLMVAESSVTNLGLEYTYYGSAVCRFYLPPEEGDSHFFSGSSDECAQVQQRFPEFILETSAAFYVTLPNPATGDCPVMPGFIDGDIPLQPVFRLWNQRRDTNHRYTSDLNIRNDMIGRGWVSEGYGPLGVVMCLP